MAEINPYTPPLSNSLVKGEREDTQLFNTKHRLGRLRYSAYLSLIYFFSFGVLSICVSITKVLIQQGNISYILNMIVLGVFCLFCFICIIILSYRRLYDLNQNGWLVVVIFIPAVGFFIWLFLLVIPGTKGPNKYGLPPKKNSLSIILSGLIIPVILGTIMFYVIQSPSY